MSDDTPRDDFYIGYESAMPAGLVRTVRRAVCLGILAATSVAVLAVAGQQRLPVVRHDFGHVHSYTGMIRVDPYPRLELRDGETARSYWLAGPKKHGAEPLVAGWHDWRVELDASLIERDTRRMLELEPGSIQGLAAAGPSRASPKFSARSACVARSWTASAGAAS